MHTLADLKKPLVIENSYIRDAFESLKSRYLSFGQSNPHIFNYHKTLLLSEIITHTVDLLLNQHDTLPVPVSNRNASLANRGCLIEDYLSQHFAEPDVLRNLAQFLHLSVRQTQTAIKKTMNMNFKELILRQKFTTARYLIENTKTPLDQIAENVGYKSYSSFYTAYVNYFGCPPHEHRPKS